MKIIYSKSPVFLFLLSAITVSFAHGEEKSPELSTTAIESQIKNHEMYHLKMLETPQGVFLDEQQIAKIKQKQEVMVQALLAAPLKDKISFILKQTRDFPANLDPYIFDQLLHLTVKLIQHAQELREQGFISFYHTRPAEWEFIAQVGRALKHQGTPIKLKEINFFSTDPYAASENVQKAKLNHKPFYPKISPTLANNYLGLFGEGARASTISASIFLTSLEEGESALTIFASAFRPGIISSLKTENPPHLEMSSAAKNSLKILLKRNNLEDKFEPLVSLYKKTFKQIHFVLHHVAISENEVDNLVVLTKSFAGSVEDFNKVSTSTILKHMSSPQTHQALLEFLNQKSLLIVRDVQARMVYDEESFLNSDKVKSYIYYGIKTSDADEGFSESAQNEYWHHLNEILFSNPDTSS